MPPRLDLTSTISNAHVVPRNAPGGILFKLLIQRGILAPLCNDPLRRSNPIASNAAASGGIGPVPRVKRSETALLVSGFG
jgi:hypothetical protein